MKKVQSLNACLTQAAKPNSRSRGWPQREREDVIQKKVQAMQAILIRPPPTHTEQVYLQLCLPACLPACLCLAYKVPITYHTTDWQPVHVLRRLAPSSRSDPLPALCPLLSFSLFFLIFFFFSHFPCTQFYPFHLDLPPSRRRILIPNAAAIYLRCPRVRDQLA